MDNIVSYQNVDITASPIYDVQLTPSESPFDWYTRWHAAYSSLSQQTADFGFSAPWQAAASMPSEHTDFAQGMLSVADNNHMTTFLSQDFTFGTFTLVDAPQASMVGDSMSAQTYALSDADYDQSLDPALIGNDASQLIINTNNPLESIIATDVSTPPPLADTNDHSDWQQGTLDTASSNTNHGLPQDITLVSGPAPVADAPIDAPVDPTHSDVTLISHTAPLSDEQASDAGGRNITISLPGYEGVLFLRDNEALSIIDGQVSIVPNQNFDQELIANYTGQSIISSDASLPSLILNTGTAPSTASGTVVLFAQDMFVQDSLTLNLPGTDQLQASVATPQSETVDHTPVASTPLPAPDIGQLVVVVVEDQPPAFIPV